MNRSANRIIRVALLLHIVLTSFSFAQPWKKGLLKDEFIYEKAPFPECHASTIVETPTGLVAAFFGGTHERHKDVCIWICRLENGQWTAPQNVADGVVNDTLRHPTWNPVLFQIPNGELMLFYKIGPSPSTWEGWLKTSPDGGKTWSAAKALPKGFIGPVKNKPILLENGTLLCPSSTEHKGWRLHMEASNDFGKTWRIIGPLNDGKEVNAIQPSVLNHGNGKLQILGRTRNRAIFESWSNDFGETWSPVTLGSLPNNNSGTDAVTMKNGQHILVYNHVLPPGKEAKGPRTPLNVSVSKNGKDWQAGLIIEDSPISQYSYPAIIQTSDGLVHVVYTWRRLRIKHAVIDPKKLKLKKIENGVWPTIKDYVAPVALSDDQMK